MDKNISLQQRLKHLRGRHDQRDHAWNRGMGKGGGYMPAALSPQQFQDIRNDFKNKVASGEMTQQVADATLKRIREIYNSEYDRNIDNQLSRRDSAISTFANRRIAQEFSRNISVSSHDLFVNATNSALANMRTYRGEGFQANWARVGMSEMTGFDATEKTYFDYINFRGDTGINYFGVANQGDALKNKMLAIFSKLLSHPAEHPIRSIRIAREVTAYGSSIANVNRDALLDPYSLLSQDAFTNFMNELKSVTTAEAAEALFKDRHKQLDDLLECYYAASRINWDPDAEQIEEMWNDARNDYDLEIALRYIEEAQGTNRDNPIPQHISEIIRTAKVMKYMLQPALIMAVGDMMQSAETQDPYASLASNIMTSYDMFPDGPLPTKINDDAMKAFIAGQAISSEKKSGKIFSDEIFQDLVEAATTNPYYKRDLKRNFNITTEDVTVDQLRRPVLTTSDTSDATPLMASQSGIDSFGKLINARLIQDLSALKDQYGLSQSPEAKEAMKKVLTDNLSALYAAASNFNPNMDTDIGRSAGNLIGALIESQFNTPLWSQYDISLDDQIQMHSQISERNNAFPYSEIAIESLQIEKERRELANIPIEQEFERNLTRIENQINLNLRAGGPESARQALDREYDDIAWQRMLMGHSEWQSLHPEQQLLERLRNQTFRSPMLAMEIQNTYERMRINRRADVGDLLTLAENNVNPTDYINYVNAEIASSRLDGTPDADIQEQLEGYLSDVSRIHPLLDLSTVQDVLVQQFGTSAFVNNSTIDYDSFQDVQKEAWGNRTPVLITKDSVIPENGLTFGSDSFAYGNKIFDLDAGGMSGNDSAMPPDNPDDVPLFNPRSARYGIRDEIEKKKNNPVSVFAKHQADKEKLKTKLRDIGYSDELIDKIINNLNDSLIPTRRSSNDDLTIFVSGGTSESVMLAIGFGDYGANDEFKSTGQIKIRFNRDPKKTSLDTHVNYMIIPKEVNNQPNPYRGGAGPLLMYSADQLRRISYDLQSPHAYYTATAANIENKLYGSNSGPTTWPVLGATCPVNITKDLVNQLLSMGYSHDFVKYLVSLPNQNPPMTQIPSNLLFTNAPPSIFVLDRTEGAPPGMVKIPTTAQKLWAEIYYTNAVPRGFPVTLNVATPNDSGRLWNPFILGRKRKEWVSFDRIKYIISLRRYKTLKSYKDKYAKDFTA